MKQVGSFQFYRSFSPLYFFFICRACSTYKFECDKHKWKCYSFQLDANP